MGVPLGALPARRAGPLSGLVPGPRLAYAEAADPAKLAQVLASEPWAQSLQKSGAFHTLSLGQRASTLTALAQRLDDLSRSPVGDGAVEGLLEGPAALGLRADVRGPGGWDLLLVKALPPRAAHALRWAEMLEAVHPSAQQVRVERHQGIPVRHLRLDGQARVYYFVLRDTVVFGTDLAWVKASLDQALGLAPPDPAAEAQVAGVRAGAPEGAFLVVDGALAPAAPGLGGLGRAAAGWAWLGLRYRPGHGLEVGARAAAPFAPDGPPLPWPAGTLLAIGREARPSALLEPVPQPLRTDGGTPPPRPGAELLGLVGAALDATTGPHLGWGLTHLDAEAAPHAQHLLLLESRAPEAAQARLQALAGRALAVPLLPLAAHPGVSCAGGALCVGAVEPGVLGLATGSAAWDAKRGGRGPPQGPLSVFIDPEGLAARLVKLAVAEALERTPEAGRKEAQGELQALLEPWEKAFVGARPQRAAAHATGSELEVWARFEAVP